MKLYHYTKFSNFCSIWIQQKLKFSEWTNSNDVYEREKIYNFTQHSKEYKGKMFPSEVFQQFVQNVFKEVEHYKQISFGFANYFLGKLKRPSDFAAKKEDVTNTSSF